MLCSNMFGVWLSLGLWWDSNDDDDDDRVPEKSH